MPIPLKGAKKIVGSNDPIWTGPSCDGPQGGITQSLLGKFMVCRERFRVHVIEGLRVDEGFNHNLEFGNMFHLCEETRVGGGDWLKALVKYCNKLMKEYPADRPTVDKWYECCKALYPHYLEYWRHAPQEKNRTPLLQEVSFRVPYDLPSGRMVWLRGKWDEVDLIGPKKSQAIWLGDHKTKGTIDFEEIAKQLLYDNQTMLYVIALETAIKKNTYGEWQDYPLKGIRYNIVRRPLSGGKGTIRPHKARGTKPAETMQHFYERLSATIEDNAEHFFHRFECEISRFDIKTYKEKTLNNILEQLCDWWEWITSKEGRKKPFANPVHWRYPYGIFNPMDKGKRGAVDFYLENGSQVGLYKAKTLFPELEE